MKNSKLKKSGRPHSPFVILVAWLLSVQLAFGTLTATVTPGYQFGPNETPTIASLNLLADPSILISGTVDGTTGLTPGSVNGALLADSVVDGITLDYNAASPRAIEVMAGGISTNQINISLFAGGVIGGGGTPIALVLDTNYFQLATNSIANTNSIAPTNGVPDTNNVLHPFPWLTFVPGSLTDTNIGTNAQIRVTKLQNLGTNGMIASTPGGTNVPAAMGLPFVLNPFTTLFTNYSTNLTLTGTNIMGQPTYSTNILTNLTSQVSWTFNLQQVTTNISLPNVSADNNSSPPATFTVPHFFSEVPAYVHAYLMVLGTNIVTTNIVGSVTNYFTNAPNITSQFVSGSAIDWRDVYYSTQVNGSAFSTAAWNATNDIPLFSYSADSNYVYVTEAGLNKLNGQSYFWHIYTNSVSGNRTGGFGLRSLIATNFQLNLLIRY